MRATVMYAPGDVRIDEVPDPVLAHPTDALVRVTASCVCGSDLWPYRGVDALGRKPRRFGHEFVGVVEAVGAEVTTVRPGDFVVAPFNTSCGTCAACRNGVPSACANAGFWGMRDHLGVAMDAGQGEAVRVPLADGTLVATPEVPDASLVPALLTLSDVMATGHHAAVTAGVGPGSRVAVVGDGAVGLCAVLAAARLGAEQVIAMSRHEARTALARRFGATEVVAERGAEGAARVLELTDGLGVDAVLECVGTAESVAQALAAVRAGGAIGVVGAPHGVELPARELFMRNIRLGGGPAAVRHYLPELMADVVAGTLDPGPVFDLELPLDEVAGAYAAMDERRATKVLLRP